MVSLGVRPYFPRVPQILISRPYNETVDVYSFGICLMVVIHNEPLYIERQFRTQNRTAVATNKWRPVPREAVSAGQPEVWDIIQKSWSAEPAARPTFAEIKVMLGKIIVKDASSKRNEASTQIVELQNDIFRAEAVISAKQKEVEGLKEKFAKLKGFLMAEAEQNSRTMSSTLSGLALAGAEEQPRDVLKSSPPPSSASITQRSEEFTAKADFLTNSKTTRYLTNSRARSRSLSQITPIESEQGFLFDDLATASSGGELEREDEAY